LVAVAAMATAPARLINEAPLPEPSTDLQHWLAEREALAAHATAIIPGTEKRIRWQDGLEDRRSRLAVVYLHGFSATRQELAPVVTEVADALGANLFETRLAGHGLAEHPLTGVVAEDWLDDAAEALAIGARIGEQIVLMGTSTGATLALAMADHPAFAPVTILVLISPNFGPRDRNAEFLTWPGGPQLAYLVAGSTRSWEARNDLQARYWATSYPMDAAVEMMRLVKFTRDALPRRLDAALLTLYSPEDSVVDPRRIEASFEQIEAPRRQLVAISGAADPGQHVLAGDIMSPQTNRQVVDLIVGFVRGRPIE
jgi:alpha-beta hydrolase superfamily lysophospholipase